VAGTVEKCYSEIIKGKFMSFSEVPPLNVGGGAASDVKRLKAEMEDLLRERRQVRYKGIRGAVLFCMAVFWVPLCARWGRADRLVTIRSS